MNNAEKQVAAASLRNEATVIKQTRENYKEARANIEEKIKVLSERDQTRSVIWQKQYQEALKEQLDGAIDALSNNNYANIHQYLEGEYENGFIGSMYSLQKQGIPLAMPIDQRRVVKMVETTANNIKLSRRLYGNTTKLKNAVRREVSIGLASGESYENIAGRLSRTMGVDYSKTIRIARTEGGRMQNGSRFDAMTASKEAGADVVKQWDSTLDGRTRPEHKQLDGQIRELEEPFEVNGKKALHPHGFGIAAMDINCRCVMLQRARWAVDGSNPDFEDYTKWDRNSPVRISENGKSISQIVDLSDAKNFADFKARYKEVAANLTQTLATQQIGVAVAGETPITIDRSADVYSTLETEHVDKIAELLSKAPNQNAAKLYARYEKDFTLLDGNYRKGAHFTPRDRTSGKTGVNMNVKQSFEGAKKKSMQTWFHEFGHHADYLATGKGTPHEKFKAYGLLPKDMYASTAYKDNLFGRTIAEEVDDLVKARQKELKAAWTKAANELDYDWMRENVQDTFDIWNLERVIAENPTSAEIKKSNFFKTKTNKSAAYASVEKELREISDENRSSISDIFEGATSAKIQAGWGHGKSYWKNQDKWADQKYHGLASEAFAHYMEYIANPEGFEVLKKYLPESSKVFDEILEAISKGEI